MSNTKKKVSMQVVADKLGITKVSVSKALNNAPGVSTELRQKIIDTCNEMGYILKKNETKENQMTFIVIIHNRFFLGDDKFYPIISYELNKACQSKGYNFRYHIINDDDCKGLSEELSITNISGIFIFGEIPENLMISIKSYNIPIVAVDVDYSEYNIDSVLTDNYTSAYIATKYLINTGVSKIGFVGDIKNAVAIMDRYMGFYKALLENDLSPACLISESDYYCNYYKQIELPKEIPEAFFCHCDKAAYVLIDKLKSMGISIPEDVKVLGFDNTEIATFSNPKISSMNVDKSKMGNVALDMMISRITNLSKEIEVVKLASTLIVRKSTNILSE